MELGSKTVEYLSKSLDNKKNTLLLHIIGYLIEWIKKWQPKPVWLQKYKQDDFQTLTQ